MTILWAVRAHTELPTVAFSALIQGLGASSVHRIDKTLGVIRFELDITFGLQAGLAGDHTLCFRPHSPAGKSRLAGVLKLLGEGVVKAKLPASCMHQGTRLSQAWATWAQPQNIPAARSIAASLQPSSLQKDQCCSRCTLRSAAGAQLASGTSVQGMMGRARLSVMLAAAARGQACSGCREMTSIPNLWHPSIAISQQKLQLPGRLPQLVGRQPHLPPG